MGFIVIVRGLYVRLMVGCRFAAGAAVLRQRVFMAAGRCCIIGLVRIVGMSYTAFKPLQLRL
jgi:hypothetical protein